MWPNLDHLIETIPDAPSYLLIFNWDGHPEAPDQPEMAFSLEGELCYAFSCAWDDPSDDAKFRDWTTDLMRGWEPYAWGTMLADENLANRPSRFMHPGNLKTLDSIRSVWDPDHTFVEWLGRPA
jgi:hypothetical protein